MVSVADVPVGSVTTTSTTPAAWGGVVTVMLDVEFTTRLVAATPPKVTVKFTFEGKFVPVTVICVPPAIGPVAGLALVTVKVVVVVDPLPPGWLPKKTVPLLVPPHPANKKHAKRAIRPLKKLKREDREVPFFDRSI